MKFHRLILLLPLIFLPTIPTTTWAQLGGFSALSEGLPFEHPSYHVEPSIEGRIAFENQLNTQGALGRLRLSPFYFMSGTPQQANIYSYERTVGSRTFAYRVIESTSQSTAFLAQLNHMGAEGWRFLGPENTTSGDYTDPLNPIFPETSHVFVRQTGTNEQFEYAVSPQATNAASFLELVNSRGQESWQWLSSFSTNGSMSLTFDELFVRKIGSTSRFTYRLLPQSQNATTALTTMNTQGTEHYRWLGPYSFGTYPDLDARDIYQNQNSDRITYQYQLTSSVSNAADFLAQANAQGTNGYTFLCPITFTAEPLLSRHVYIGSINISDSVGALNIDASGQLTLTVIGNFTRFQLFRSSTLTMWEAIGAPQSGSIGSVLTWDAKTTSGATFFFRIEGLP